MEETIKPFIKNAVQFYKKEPLYQTGMVAVVSFLFGSAMFFCGLFCLVFCVMFIAMPVSIFVGREAVSDIIRPLFIYTWGPMMVSGLLLVLFLETTRLLYILFLRRPGFAAASVPRSFQKGNCTFRTSVDFSRDVMQWKDLYYVFVETRVERKDLNADLHRLKKESKNKSNANTVEQPQRDLDEPDTVYFDIYSFTIPFTTALTDDEIANAFAEKHKEKSGTLLYGQRDERLAHPGHFSGWVGGGSDFVSTLKRELVPLGYNS
jgi:hypothetical protein